MTKIIPFKRKQRRPRRYGFLPRYSGFLALLALLFVGSLSWDKPQRLSARTFNNDTEFKQSGRALHFAKCGMGARRNCVVDGDTIYLDGQKIRLAGIDTPETHPARCSYEAQLGARATHRLTELLNNGPFTVRSSGRDEDRYGRKLRTLHRSGQSLGAILVAEGLARKWQGRRLPWCT